ncbi:hypothetical protein [Lysinibacillus capsici]|uniref:hypothetical protein n=1 Tax=Lysinibacillus capsici TaxID=2115968 RepID=UPI0028AFCE1E|nr:hypothetical protein [Lysinibacillus capsici]
MNESTTDTTTEVEAGTEEETTDGTVSETTETGDGKSASDGEPSDFVGVSEEQGNKILEHVESIDKYSQEHGDKVLEHVESIDKKYDEAIQLLKDINDSPVASGETSSMTYEQAENLITAFNNVDQALTNVQYIVVFFLVWWVFRTIYRFINGTLFGGL